jgi:hypothetical protein
MGLAMIFKLGAMPYDTVERSMAGFGEAVVPRNPPPSRPRRCVGAAGGLRAKSIEEQTRRLFDT